VAYAINSEGTAYGSVQSFTTTAPPTVSTTAITTYNSTSATMGGNVTADGDATVTERGVVYSTSDNTPTIGETGVSQDVNGTTGTGAFSKSVTGLSSATTYYVVAYAINSEGTAYGSVQSFSTSTIPTLTTSSITSFDGTSATVGGNITDDGGAPVTERGIVYAATDNTPLIDEAGVIKTTHGTAETGVYSIVISDLARGTTYFVRSFATNSAGTAYGDVESFTTKDLATVTTSTAGSLKIHSVTLGGNVTDDGDLTVSACGIVFSLTDATPTIAEGALQIGIGSGTGIFNESISGLAAGTLYYFNSYAINPEGISYGTAGSFTTAAFSTFTGTANWNSDANWSAGVPLTGGTAVIEGSPTVSEEHVTVDNMTILSGSVHLSHGLKLTVIQNLSVDQNSGGIIVDGN